MGIVLAIAAALTAFYGYNSVAGMVTVAVAGTDIYQDDPASPKNVIVGKTPKGALQSDTVLKPQDLAGMSAKGFIPAGTVLRKSMFQPLQEAGVSAKLSQMGNKVAVALKSNVYSTVGGEIKPNYIVDVKSSYRGETHKVASEAVIISIPSKNNDKAVVMAVAPEEAESIMAAISNNEHIYLEILPKREG